MHVAVAGVADNPRTCNAMFSGHEFVVPRLSDYELVGALVGASREAGASGVGREVKDGVIGGIG